MTLKKLIATLPLSLSLLCSSATAATVYLADNNAQLYLGDPTTGIFTLVGPTDFAGGPVQLTDIAFSPGGTLYGDDGSTLYTVDPTSGNLTLVGSNNVADFLNALEVGSAGTIFAAGGDDLYFLDPATGQGTLLGSGGGAGTYDSSGDLAFAPSNLFLTSVTAGTDELFSVNPTTGAGTDIGNTGFATVYGLATVNGTLYGFTSLGQEISINTLTGAGTLLFAAVPDTFGAAALPMATASTPEPGTAGAILLGLTGLVRIMRRRRV